VYFLEIFRDHKRRRTVESGPKDAGGLASAPQRAAEDDIESLSSQTATSEGGASGAFFRQYWLITTSLKSLLQVKGAPTMPH
jgi:hypothetical protein